MKAFNHIQALRFFAAISVVAVHSFGASETYLDVQRSAFFNIFDYGYFGVDVFFVISGFIIYCTARKQGQAALPFLTRRFERVVPLYWGATLAKVCCAIAAPFAVNDTHWLSIGNIAESLAFVTFTDASRLTVVNVGWTLEFEIFFYLSAALILSLANKRWNNLSIGFCLLVMLGFFQSGTMSPFYNFVTSPLLLEFVFGVLVARLIYNDGLQLLELGLVVAAASTVVMRELHNTQTLDGNLRVIVAGAPAAALVFLAAYFNEKPIFHSWLAAVLIRLGDASYSIYLVQAFTISFFCKLWVAAKLPALPDLLSLLAIVLTIIGGYAVYVFVEAPMLRWCRARLQPQAQASF